VLFSLGVTLSGNSCNNAYTALSNSNQTNPLNLLCFGTANAATGTINSSADCNVYMLTFSELVRKRCITR